MSGTIAPIIRLYVAEATANFFEGRPPLLGLSRADDTARDLSSEVDDVNHFQCYSVQENINDFILKDYPHVVQVNCPQMQKCRLQIVRLSLVFRTSVVRYQRSEHHFSWIVTAEND